MAKTLSKRDHVIGEVENDALRRIQKTEKTLCELRYEFGKLPGAVTVYARALVDLNETDALYQALDAAEVSALMLLSREHDR